LIINTVCLIIYVRESARPLLYTHAYVAGVKGRPRGYIAVASRSVHRGPVHVANNGRDVRDESDTGRPVRPGHQFRNIQIHDVLQFDTIHHVSVTLQRECGPSADKPEFRCVA